MQEIENILFILGRVESFFNIYTLIVSDYKCANWTFILRCLQIFLNIWMKEIRIISFHFFLNSSIIIQLLYSL